MNINVLDISASTDYCNLISIKGFVNVVDQPTYFREQEAYESCLDHVLITGLYNKSKLLNVNYYLVDIPFSDHRGLDTTIFLSEPMSHAQCSVGYFFDMTAFCKKILDWNIDPIHTSQASVNEKFEWFLTNLTDIVEKCKVKITPNKRKYKQKRNPWVTETI